MSAELPRSTPVASEAFAVSLQHHQDGRLSEAAAIYRAILAVDPDNAATHDALGKALMGKGDMADAKACYARAIAINPDFFGPHYHLGNLLLGHGMAEDAVVSYRRCIALKPDFTAALYALMHAFTSLAVRLSFASDLGSRRLDGQEVYSLAILMTELTAGGPAAPRVELIGTAINTRALQRARTGHYLSFRFEPELRQSILKSFHAALKPGGWQVGEPQRARGHISRNRPRSDDLHAERVISPLAQHAADECGSPVLSNS